MITISPENSRSLLGFLLEPAQSTGACGVSAEGDAGVVGVRWDYLDRMVMFTETPDGLASGLEWLTDAGRKGWELVAAIPLIAPNKDGVAYGTVGVHLIFKRRGAAELRASARRVRKRGPSPRVGRRGRGHGGEHA